MNTSANEPLGGPLLRGLRDLLGHDELLTDPGDCWAYGYDNSRRQGLAGAVAVPRSVERIAPLVALCNEHRVPLVTRGAGTGTTGASVPPAGAVMLALHRLDRILEIDPDNRIARVEPGVTNQALQQALAPHGFFWPPDPTSAAVCTVGGNLACNSAGPRAVKYGTPRDNTLGLGAVTGSGEPLRCGVLTTKGVVGYDLTRLLIGSEGTLAVITEAMLRLTPLPEARRTLRAIYRDVDAAARAVSRIMAQPTTPCALEFMDAAALAMVRDHASVTLPDGTGALLMIEIDGPASGLDAAASAIADAAAGDGLLELRAAAGAAEIAELWAMRKALSPALRNLAPKKINEDVAVPVSRIPALVAGLERLAAETGIRIVNFGHAGNGNLHVNILLDPDDPQQAARARECLERTFRLVLELGGTLSGEHGVGIEKRDYVAWELDPAALRLMHAIKAQFDPNGILNPGKTLPPAA